MCTSYSYLSYLDRLYHHRAITTCLRYYRVLYFPALIFKSHCDDDWAQLPCLSPQLVGKFTLSHFFLVTFFTRYGFVDSGIALSRRYINSCIVCRCSSDNDTLSHSHHWHRDWRSHIPGSDLLARICTATDCDKAIWRERLFEMIASSWGIQIRWAVSDNWQLSCTGPQGSHAAFPHYCDSTRVCSLLAWCWWHR